MVQIMVQNEEVEEPNYGETWVFMSHLELLPFYDTGVLEVSLKHDRKDLQNTMKDYHPLAFLFLKYISDKIFTKKTIPSRKLLE